MALPSVVRLPIAALRGSAAQSAPHYRFVPIALVAAVVGGLNFDPGAAIAQEIVQPLPPPGLTRLEDALRVLARDPKNVDALVDAGAASLALGDTSAAIGFLGRADDLRPGDAQVQSGLARAALQGGDPVNALARFAAAERAGARSQAIATDRGLAYDLVGDPRAAQAQYAVALSAGADDEATRRLAISQAVAGQRAAMEGTLRPLLQRQDRSAFRARAFALAILGDTREAVGIANAVMPPALSAKIAPYLSYMPRLTQAQQAAAANLGQFPRAAEIGRDDPRVAAYRNSGTALANAASVGGQTGAPAFAVNIGQPGPASEPVAGSAVRATEPSRSDIRREARRQTQLARSDARTPSQTGAGAEAGVAQAAPAQPASSPPPPVRTAMAPSATAFPAITATPMTAETGFVTPSGAAPAGVAGEGDGRSVTGAAGSALAAAGIAARPPASAPVPARLALTLPTITPALPPASVVAGAVAEQPSPALLPELASSAPGSLAIGPAAGVSASVPLAIVIPPSTVADGTSAFGADTGIAAGAGLGLDEGPVPDDLQLAEAFAAFAAPVRSTTPATGAVDLTAIDIRREARPAPPPPPKAEAKPVPKPKPAPPPPPPPVPSRVWVQVATGRDVGALGFDWRRITRVAGPTLKGRDAFVAEWGRTRRLLTGPYPDARSANAAVSALKAKDLDAFVFTSSTGEAVDPLPGG